MAKENTMPVSGFFNELFHVGLYKRNQGRVTRQVTFASVAIATALAAWKMVEAETASALTEGWFFGSAYLIPGVVLLGGLWLSYRIVNLPQFADFLIAVEAEMAKVSWPSWGELVRSSMVVIFVIFSMALMLFVFDAVWKFLFTWLEIVQ